MTTLDAHPSAATAAPPTWTWPRWIAHRGAGKLAPENTLAAFRLGAAHGFRAYECDVKLSADGEPFLLHDATLERTTNGRGTAGDLPWGALACLDAGGWHSRAYAGEPPPHLTAIARWCLAGGYALNIEIKPTPGVEAQTGHVVASAVRQLWGEAVAAGRAGWPLFSSFQPLALATAARSAPEIPRALLVDAFWTAGVGDAAALAELTGSAALAAAARGDEGASADWLSVAQALGAQACVLNHQLVDAALIERLHGLGLRVMVYTVNEPARAAELLGWGLDGVITDAVDRMVPTR